MKYLNIDSGKIMNMNDIKQAYEEEKDNYDFTGLENFIDYGLDNGYLKEIKPKYRVKYPYAGSKREIEYRGYRAYMCNDFGYWACYCPDIKIRMADTRQGILNAIDSHIDGK